MEDVRTFMLLEGELCLKVLPLDWIIFSEIPGYLKDEDNENSYGTILSSKHTNRWIGDNFYDQIRDIVR